MNVLTRGFMGIDEALKAREEYNRYQVLKGVEKLDWDVCIYYVLRNKKIKIGIMRGTPKEVIDALFIRFGKILEHFKLSDLIKGLYEQGKDA